MGNPARVSSVGQRAKCCIDITFTLLIVGLTIWLSSNDMSRISGAASEGVSMLSQGQVNIWPSLGLVAPPTSATATSPFRIAAYETILPLPLSATTVVRLPTSSTMMAHTNAPATVSPTSSRSTVHSLRAYGNVYNTPSQNGHYQHLYFDQVQGPAFANVESSDAYHEAAPVLSISGHMHDGPSNLPSDFTLYPQPALSDHGRRQAVRSVPRGSQLSDNVPARLRNGISRDRDTRPALYPQQGRRMGYALQQYQRPHYNTPLDFSFASEGPSYGSQLYPSYGAGQTHVAPGYGMPQYHYGHQQVGYAFDQALGNVPAGHYVSPHLQAHTAQPFSPFSSTPDPAYSFNSGSEDWDWNQPYQVVDPTQFMSARVELPPLPPPSSLSTLRLCQLRPHTHAWVLALRCILRTQSDVEYPHTWTHQDNLFHNGLLDHNVVGRFIGHISQVSPWMNDAILEAFFAESTYQLHFHQGDRSGLHPGPAWLKSMPLWARKRITNVSMQLDWYTGATSPRHTEQVHMVKDLGVSHNLQRLDLSIDIATMKPHKQEKFWEERLVKLLVQFRGIPNVKITMVHGDLPELAVYLRKHMTLNSPPTSWDKWIRSHAPQLMDHLRKTSNARDWTIEDYAVRAVTLGFDLTKYTQMPRHDGQGGIVAGADQYKRGQKQRFKDMESAEQKEREALKQLKVRQSREAEEKSKALVKREVPEGYKANVKLEVKKEIEEEDDHAGASMA